MSDFRLFRDPIMQSDSKHSLTLNTIQQGKLQQHNCQCYWYCNTYTHNKNSTPSLYSNMFITCVCALKKKKNGALCPTNAGTNVYVMHSLCSSRSKYTKTCGHEQNKKKVNTEIHPKYGENKFSLPAMQQGTLVMQMRDWWIVRIVNTHSNCAPPSLLCCNMVPHKRPRSCLDMESKINCE